MDSIGFWGGKILWAIFSPAHLIVILFIISFFLANGALLKSFIRGLTAIFFLFALLFPIGDWALLPLEHCNADQAPPMHADGVIVLGGAVNTSLSEARREIAFTDSADRIFQLLKLVRQYPSAQFVYTGGNNSLKQQNSAGEAEYVRQLLEGLGAKPQAIVFQSQSRNTYEDAIMTKDIYAKIPRQNWLLVTSAFHMPRSYGLFQKLGEASQTSFYPLPVDYKTSGKFKFEMRMDMLQTLLKLDTAAHEYVGLLFNVLMHRADSFLTCSAKSQLLQ